jgi:hypothetical protein
MNYTFDLKCPRCRYVSLLTLTETPPTIHCLQCEAELIIVGVHVGLDIDPSDGVNLFHYVNDQRSNHYERTGNERALRDAPQSVRGEPAE